MAGEHVTYKRGMRCNKRLTWSVANPTEIAVSTLQVDVDKKFLHDVCKRGG